VEVELGSKTLSPAVRRRCKPLLSQLEQMEHGNDLSRNLDDCSFVHYLDREFIQYLESLGVQLLDNMNTPVACKSEG
jgi:hypothetical protein